MKNKLKSLKKYLRDTSAPRSIIQYLEDLELEINNKKYGLSFEEHSEEIERIIENNDTELIEQKKLRIGKNRNMDANFLIEGENLAVLKQLEKTLLKRIDVICIDPPYNTGMHSLNYNDYDFIDENDTYIHSKWLSYIKKRIDCAYSLLTDHGTMFINIDENEIGNLLLLCGQIFGEKNIDVLIWPKTDPRFDKNRVEKPFHNIKIVHEYVLVCFKDKSKTTFNKIHRPIWTNNDCKDTIEDMETILKGLGTTSSAKDEIAEIFGNRYRFQTPKPRKIIKEFVRAASKRDSIILDFFAGSGTTGHAVMDLNKEDNGNRKFILVTNNENNICRDITYQRLRKAVEKELYTETIVYFTIRFKPKSKKKGTI